jgi:S-adenosylmethionine decarboxylase
MQVIEGSSIEYAGIHITIDIWGASGLNDAEHIDGALRKAVTACGATMLELFLHRFEPQGITGVAVLAESHMSIHAWPEIQYAAIDVFTCGTCDPLHAVPVFQEAFAPNRIQVTEQKRGLRVSTAVAITSPAPPFVEVAHV